MTSLPFKRRVGGHGNDFHGRVATERTDETDTQAALWHSSWNRNGETRQTERSWRCQTSNAGVFSTIFTTASSNAPYSSIFGESFNPCCGVLFRQPYLLLMWISITCVCFDFFTRAFRLSDRCHKQFSPGPGMKLNYRWMNVDKFWQDIICVKLPPIQLSNFFLRSNYLLCIFQLPWKQVFALHWCFTDFHIADLVWNCKLASSLHAFYLYKKIRGLFLY